MYVENITTLRQTGCLQEAPQEVNHSSDDVEHTFFEWDRWWRRRRELEVALNFSPVTPENLMEAMIESRAKWDVAVNFIDAVLTKKEEDEKIIQAAA